MEPLSTLSPEDSKLYVGRIYRNSAGKGYFRSYGGLRSGHGFAGRNPEDYLLKLREAQSILVQVTQDYLKRNQRKKIRGGPKNLEVTKFAAIANLS